MSNNNGEVIDFMDGSNYITMRLVDGTEIVAIRIFESDELIEVVFPHIITTVNTRESPTSIVKNIIYEPLTDLSDDGKFTFQKMHIFYIASLSYQVRAEMQKMITKKLSNLSNIN